MKLGKITQAPIENRKIAIDYTMWLEDAEIISSLSYESVPTGPTISNAGLTLAGKGVLFFLGGGTDGDTYRVAVQVTTSLGQVREDWLLLAVKDPEVS